MAEEERRKKALSEAIKKLIKEAEELKKEIESERRS